MPIAESPNHQAGEYPGDVRHISNGDPANQNFLRNPMLDFEYRTDVIKDFVNGLEATVLGNYSLLDSFDKNHDHSGSLGEKNLDFAQIYANSSQTLAFLNLASNGALAIKKTGDETADDLLFLDDAASVDKEQIIFPGSVALFEHRDAPASDLTTKPHNLALAGRVFAISHGCLINGAASGPYTDIVLDPTMAEGGVFSATGLVGKDPSDGVSGEGVLVGDLTSPGSQKPNIVLLRDLSGLPIVGSSKPIYGLLEDVGTVGAPSWRLSFFEDGAPYSFASDSTVLLYAQEAHSLSTVPVADPRFAVLAQTGWVV